MRESQILVRESFGEGFSCLGAGAGILFCVRENSCKGKFGEEKPGEGKPGEGKSRKGKPYKGKSYEGKLYKGKL